MKMWQEQTNNEWQAGSIEAIPAQEINMHTWYFSNNKLQIEVKLVKQLLV